MPVIVKPTARSCSATSWICPGSGCINIHSSLLPRWRGAAPIQHAILAGDAESGVSTMHLVEKLDAGDVLLQARTPIGSQDTAGSLHDRLMKLGAELILPTLAGLGGEGTLKGSGARDRVKITYASKLAKEMERSPARPRSERGRSGSQSAGAQSLAGHEPLD